VVGAHTKVVSGQLPLLQFYNMIIHIAPFVPPVIAEGRVRILLECDSARGSFVVCLVLLLLRFCLLYWSLWWLLLRSSSLYSFVCGTAPRQRDCQ
jgi:hypothetical protein